MKNRYIPFGYHIRQGQVEVHPVEAETVRQVFTLYTSGLGYQEIAKHLDKSGIEYHEGARWNKHMVKRMLENRRYIGEKNYPAIVGNSDFDSVLQRKALASNMTGVRNPKHSPVAAHHPIPCYSPTTRIRRMEREISGRLGQRTAFDITSMILQCAAEKYNSLESGEVT